MVHPHLRGVISIHSNFCDLSALVGISVRSEFTYVVSARKRAVLKIARDFGLILRAGFVKLAGGAARWGGFYGKSSRCGHTAPLASFA